MPTQPHGIPVHASADDILDALDPEQREVAAHPLGPMVVLAGAGTGKTRAITHRIAYGVHSGAYQGQRVLAVTFTARAAGEMRTRLRTLGVGGVQARTFHAAALRQLHYFWPQAIGGAAPEVMSQKAAAVAQAAASLRLDLARDRTAIRDLAAEVEWAKVSMLTPETYAAGARAARREPPGLDATAMARVLEAYEQVKTQRGVIDFEDVLLLTVGILAERDDIARAVRSQYRHFVVDEYQDVNALQQRLLDLWVGQRDDLCVVGDPAQTIYSFTGASPAPPARVPDPAPQGPGRPAGAQLPLDPADRRAGQPRRAWAVGLDAQQRGAAAGPGCRRTGPGADLPPGRPGRGGGRGRRDRQAGGRRGLARPRSPSCSAPTASPRRSSRRWPTRRSPTSSAEGSGSSPAGRSATRSCCCAVRPAPTTRRSRCPSWSATCCSAPAGPARRPAPGAPAASGGSRSARWPPCPTTWWWPTPEARLPDFVRELDERASAQHAPAVQGVTLASLHAAKGLEWDVVFLAGVSDGYLPIMMAETPEAIEEERRLTYVGVTRARRELRLSWSGARTPGARSQPSAVAGSSTAPRASSARAPAPQPKGAGKVGSGKGAAASRSSPPSPCTAAPAAPS